MTGQCKAKQKQESYLVITDVVTLILTEEQKKQFQPFATCGCDRPAVYLMCGITDFTRLDLDAICDASLREFVEQIREEYGTNIEIPTCESHSRGWKFT